MLRTIALLTTLSVASATASAQSWAEKMFKETNHDFGSVARSGKIEYNFTLSNPLKQDVHIASVRSSCGCTTPSILKETLKPGEESAIVAAFNSHLFTGHRSARVTVTFDQPQWAEVTLQIQGRIRTDIVVNPGQVELGSVDLGSTAEKTADIVYAGRGDWKITSAKASSPYLTATVKEVSRDAGRVSYTLSVTLDKNAPAGYLKDQIQLATNDQRAPQFPVPVEALIVPDVTISPSSLMLGSLGPGDKVSKQVLIKAKQPFHVLSVKCDDNEFTFKHSDEAKTVHLIPLIFTAGTQQGEVSTTIRIETDLPNHATIELPAVGHIGEHLASR